MVQPYRLYGAQISYFTGKVRAYLRWKSIPYVEVVSDAGVFREVILPRVGFPVIPVVVTPEDETLQDSTEIIDHLERRHPVPSIQPRSGVQRLLGALFELYADEWLVIPAMHYRWHHNREWAMEAFGQVSAPDEPPARQREIGAGRAAPFARAAERLGAQPHMHAAIEASYEALLGELNEHFLVHDYALGTRPCMADFGLVGPLYAHQYRDPKSGELMRRLAPAVVRWVERMMSPERPGSGAFIDEPCPDGLRAVLQRMMREQMPVLADSARRLTAWLKEHPEEAIPRTIGFHGYALGDARGERAITPYSLWMLQRARDIFAGLGDDERATAEALLTDVGGTTFLRFPTLPRLARAGMGVRLAAD